MWGGDVMSARGETDFLEKVRAVADIREIISGYLPLKKSGSRFRGLCPFHQEKTPSFYVDAGKQLFYCFGCGTGGDAFKFLMLYEKVEFPDALRILARRYGVTIPERSGGLTSERQVLLKVNLAAREYFRTILQSETEGKRGAEYLVRRNLSKETIEEFGLGFAPDRWDGVKQTLLAAGFAEAQLLSAGVVLKKEDTGRTYDRFRNRLIFPILGLSGECLGFGGRMIGEGEPKYLNSPETPVFRKGDNLYGLSHSGEAVRKAGFAVLVEGYIDFLSLYQAGFRNLVATLGTGFTPGHAKLLGRFTRRIVVNFDPDSSRKEAHVGHRRQVRRSETPDQLGAGKGVSRLRRGERHPSGGGLLPRGDRRHLPPVRSAGHRGGGLGGALQAQGREGREDRKRHGGRGGTDQVRSDTGHPGQDQRPGADVPARDGDGSSAHPRRRGRDCPPDRARREENRQGPLP